MIISKKVWKEIKNILKKYNITYITNYKNRDIQKAMEYPDITVKDKHIQINLIIPNYFEEY